MRPGELPERLACALRAKAQTLQGGTFERCRSTSPSKDKKSIRYQRGRQHDVIDVAVGCPARGAPVLDLSPKGADLRSEGGVADESLDCRRQPFFSGHIRHCLDTSGEQLEGGDANGETELTEGETAGWWRA